MIITRENREEAEQVATKKLMNMVQKVIENKGSCNLALCGGRSVSGIFDLLDIDKTKVHVWLVDERYEGEKNAELMSKFSVQKFENDLQAYEDAVVAAGGYDIALFSAGEDGHIGGLFPEHEMFLSENDWFVETNKSPKPPSHRMSMSRRHVLGLKGAIVVFFGEAKQDAFKRFLDRTTQAKQCPARLVKNLKEWYAITDTE